MPDTSDTSASRETRMQHECNTSDTSVTSATRVQYECYTNDTSATRTTRVKNFDFENDTGKNMFSHPYIYYMASERLKGEEQFHTKNYLLEIISFPCQNAFKKCKTKTKLFNGKSHIKKLYTRL